MRLQTGRDLRDRMLELSACGSLAFRLNFCALKFENKAEHIAPILHVQPVHFVPRNVLSRRSYRWLIYVSRCFCSAIMVLLERIEL